jgi:hypothetical protein
MDHAAIRTNTHIAAVVQKLHLRLLLAFLKNIQMDCEARTDCKSSHYSSRRIAHTQLRTYDSSRGKIQEAFQ